jgi:ABC-type amino acid transport substrate-binding protein
LFVLIAAIERFNTGAKAQQARQRAGDFAHLPTITIILCSLNSQDDTKVSIYYRPVGIALAILLALVLTFIAPLATAGAEPTAEIPVLIATQTGADGKEMPVPPVISGIVAMLAKESGLNLVIHAYPWRRALRMAEMGEGLLYGAAATPERAEIFYFSKPLYSVSLWLVTAAQRSFEFQTWEDLRGKVISIHSGAHFIGEFEAQRDKLFKIAENSETFTSRLKMLNMGCVDAVVIDNPRSARQFEARLNCTYADIGKWIVLDKPIGVEPVLISIAKTSRLNDVLPGLNDAIDRINKGPGFQKAPENHGGC